MYKLFKKIFIFAIIILLMTAFDSSYRYFNIDNLAFVNAIAIDSADNNNYKISFQFTKPSGSSSSPSTSEENNTFINTVETGSISSAINLMNSYMGKEVNLSHCKLIILSEKVATKGISDIVYTLINNVQVRPSSNMIITKVDAKYYLENSKPSLENLSTKYYEIFPNSSEYTGYLSNITIGEFFTKLISKTNNPCAILGGTISANGNDIDTYSPSSPEEVGDIKSNENSISGKRGSTNIGLAVFNQDILVGELTAIETACYSVINDDVDGFLVTIKNPENSEKYLDVYLSNSSIPKIKVSIVNGSPYITLDIKLTGKFYSLDANSDYLNNNFLTSVSDAVNDYMKTELSNYLYKTSKEFKSDINGFGNYALSCFTSLQSFQEYDWLENYQNAFFCVNVKSNVCSSSLLTKT